MINLASLRAKSEQEAARFPALLARADHIAGTILMGSHGRRRAGVGDDFWQYRPFQTGDSPRGIDWRRSARGDTHYVREHEWQIAQSVTLWVDQSASMDFKSDGIPESKADRARLISLALTILLTHGGERIGLAHPAIAPQRGRPQIERIAQALMTSVQTDFCAPNAEAMPPFGRAVFVSDFLGDIDAITKAFTIAADRGVRGAIVQILDPVEESFPFSGRAIFQSMGGSVEHETLEAGGLKDRYLARLAERKDKLMRMCDMAGWDYTCHHTDTPAQSALLWLWGVLDGRKS